MGIIFTADYKGIAPNLSGRPSSVVKLGEAGRFTSQWGRERISRFFEVKPLRKGRSDAYGQEKSCLRFIQALYCCLQGGVYLIEHGKGESILGILGGKNQPDFLT